jgi:hypothetical protein
MGDAQRTVDIMNQPFSQRESLGTPVLQTDKFRWHNYHEVREFSMLW